MTKDMTTALNDLARAYEEQRRPGYNHLMTQGLADAIEDVQEARQAHKDALVEVIRAERERHTNLGPKQMVFNVICTCGYIGQQVSVKGEFEEHVNACLADAIVAHAL